MSCVTCHMPHVICNMSNFTCHMTRVTYLKKNYLDKVVNLVGGGGVINGAYPVLFSDYHLVYELNSKSSGALWRRLSASVLSKLFFLPVNRNMKKFAEPTAVQIGIGRVHEFQNLRIGIGIVIVRWEKFANYSHFFLFLTNIYIFIWKQLTWQ